MRGKGKLPDPKVETFPDHEIITPPNALRGSMRYVERDDGDDPIARAEQALAGLSGEFDNWMAVECDRLSKAHATVLRDGFNKATREELFHAAHDIKGDAATFGYPTAGAAAESLCRIIEHAPDLNRVPGDLIKKHIDAIHAIVREHERIDAAGVAEELSQHLRSVADSYLAIANRDRPDHLELINGPTLAPTQ
jgi:chemotaxis protein histidine kinase CheA